MSQEPERLLETDRLEDVLDEPGPPQPVVIVQYRTKAVSWLLIVALVVAVALGSLFAYHRREVERLRAQALEARRDLQRMMAANRAEGGRMEAPPAGAAGTPASDHRPTDAAGAQAVEVTAAARSSEATQASASPGGTKPPEHAKADPAMALTQLAEKADPTRAPAVHSAPPTGPLSSDSPAPVEPPDSAVPISTAAQVPDSASPFEERPDADREARERDPAVAAAPVTAPAAARTQESVGSPAGPAAAVPAAVAPPLPSKEETERQILEEAVRNQAEADQRLSQQRQDLQGLKEDDRRHFRDELRKILQEHGKRAGKEIENLSVRSGRDDDPARRALAYRVLGTSGTSQRTKVRQLRAIGVPESVILDYLANGLNRNLGTRNGPRTPNDIWIQAARLLLTYELTPAPQGAVEGRGAREARVRPANRPGAGRRPAAGIPPTR